MTAKGDFSQRPILFSQRHYKCERTGCWLWTGLKEKDGYGRVTWPPHRNAHRWSYSEFVGPIPDGLLILHTCDTPACVNPTHLYVGTHADNTADKVSKGRQPKGESHKSSKLTTEKVAEIRRLRREAGLTIIEIARRFSMSQHGVWSAANERTWK